MPYKGKIYYRKVVNGYCMRTAISGVLGYEVAEWDTICDLYDSELQKAEPNHDYPIGFTRRNQEFGGGGGVTILIKVIARHTGLKLRSYSSTDFSGKEIPKEELLGMIGHNTGHAFGYKYVKEKRKWYSIFGSPIERTEYNVRHESGQYKYSHGVFIYGISPIQVHIRDPDPASLVSSRMDKKERNVIRGEKKVEKMKKKK